MVSTSEGYSAVHLTGGVEGLGDQVAVHGLAPREDPLGEDLVADHRVEVVPVAAGKYAILVGI